MQGGRQDFTGASGARLAARLDLPGGPPRGAALFAHCFTCGKDIAAAREIAAGLVQAGFAVLRFDFTGLGGSGGDFAHAGFSANVGDLVSAAEHMAAQGLAPGLLVGHSLGGAAVLAAAGRIGSARAVATLGAPSDPAHVLHLFGPALERIGSEGRAEVTLGGRPFTVARDFVEDLGNHRLEETVRGLRLPLMILHAPRDAVVGIDNATALFEAARHPKSFVSLGNADHLLADRADARFAAGVIAAWAGRYMAAPEAAGEAPPVGTVRVVEADPEGFRQAVLTGPRHRLTADEPESFGGTDAGPGPHDLVAAGLGACTAMTIRMVARRKGWPLDGVAVDVRHDRIHAEDCSDCATREGKVDRFTREIALFGDLTAAQRAALMAIADRCPVHRTLEGEIRIETRPRAGASHRPTGEGSN